MFDTRNYRLVYPDPRANQEEPSGGYVEVHKAHNPEETERNVETAKLLAKLGFQVRLLLVDNTPPPEKPRRFPVTRTNYN